MAYGLSLSMDLPKEKEAPTISELKQMLKSRRSHLVAEKEYVSPKVRHDRLRAY